MPPVVEVPRLYVGHAFRFGRPLAPSVFSGEEPAGQRGIGDDPDLFFIAQAEKLVLEFLPVGEVVIGLVRLEADKTLRPADR